MQFKDWDLNKQIITSSNHLNCSKSMSICLRKTGGLFHSFGPAAAQNLFQTWQSVNATTSGRQEWHKNVDFQNTIAFITNISIYHHTKCLSSIRSTAIVTVTAPTISDKLYRGKIITMASNTGDIGCIYPQRNGQAELAWAAGCNVSK